MRKLDILVVDDDRDNADSLGELFEIEGHRPHVVYNGKDAIFAYLRGEFDVGFVDVMMPGLNGVESFMEIRKLRPKAKVYMMSGYSVEELLKQALTHGALGLLRKPVSPEVLLGMVNEVGHNGLVVAQHAGPDFATQLAHQAAGHGGKLQVITGAKQAEHAGENGEVVVLDINQPLIDTMGCYTSLRKAHDMPPTIILTPEPKGQRNEDMLRDLSVTGVLNKPFDPEFILSNLEVLVA